MAYPSVNLWTSPGLYPSAEPLPPPPSPSPAAVSQLSSGSLILCDSQGQELAELEVAHTIRFERSRAGSVKFQIGYDQLGALDLLNTLADGLVPQVRAYRNRSLVFSGWWAPQQEVAQGDAQDGITCEFRTPFARLESRYVAAPTLPFAATDGAQIAFGLLAYANNESPTGLLQGAGQATISRDRTYTLGQQIAQAIIDLTALDSSFHFTETPLDSGGYLASLNLWASLGQDLTGSVRFEYGEGTIANVLSVQRTINPPVNQVILTGQDATGVTLTAVANDVTSQYLTGLFAISSTLSDTTDQATLDEKALGMLQPYFVQQVTFSPDLNTDPQPIDDYWLGDTVSFYASQDALQIQTAAQITAIEIDRDGDGLETAHRLEFGQQVVRPLIPVRRGRRILFRDPARR